MKRYRALYLSLFLLMLLASSMPFSNALNYVSVTGEVMDFDTGEPIEGALVEVYSQRYWRRYSSRWEPFQTIKTDSEGVFSLKIESGENYRIIVSYFDGDQNYVPYGKYVRSDFDESLIVSLMKAASIKIRGRAYFIETSSIPSNTYKVLNATSETILKSGDLSLTYGSQTESFTELVNIQGDTVLVPSDSRILIEVISNVKIGEKTSQRTMILDDFSGGLEPGQYVDVDLRSKVLPESLLSVRNDSENLRGVINEKEEEGFYLAVERHRLSELERLIQEAETLHDIESYESSFTKLREAYILYKDLNGIVHGIVGDAARSTYILVVFITVSSFILGSIMHDSNLLKIMYSLLFDFILLSLLRFLHPGIPLIGTLDFILVSLSSFLFLSTLSLIIPRLMSAGGGGEVSIINMIIPILSIAKRSLRRRWIRFGLTIFSVIMLVGSFISLTSFSTGYGLNVKKASSQGTDNFGVLIRTPNPPPEKAAAPFSGGNGAAGSVPLGTELVNWLAEDIQPILLAPKYSTQPQRQYREEYNPVGRLGNTNLFGVLGILPTVESSLTGFDSLVIEGSYLTDEDSNEILIGRELLSTIDAQLGDAINLRCFDTNLKVKIIGVLDDEAFSQLRDLDGDPIIPQKIIEYERIEMDGPDFVTEGLAYCEPHEVVVINHKTAESLSGIWINRISLTLPESINLLEFSQRLAINRGFRVWASTKDGVFLSQLAGYFEGKGLPVIIPWIIVMLNVVITMLNSYYERSREIMIYSSIGMNPRQISTIFLGEAGVVGLVGGSLGYIVGLAAYKFIYLVTPSLQVEQKVSAAWSLAAIGISLTAVLVGGVVALLNSTNITPSLIRRWRANKAERRTDSFVIELPIEVLEEELVEYISFLEEELNKSSKGFNFTTKMIKKREEDGKWIFEFVYSNTGTSISTVYTKNRLIIEKNDGDHYLTRLECVGDENGAQAAGSLIRKIGLGWSLSRSDRSKTSIIQDAGDL